MLKLTVPLLLTAPNVQVLAVGSPEQAKLPTLEAFRLPVVVMVIVAEPDPPGADMVTVLGLAASVKPAACTTCCTAEDVLVANVVFPVVGVYVAVITFVPTASVDVVNVATPLLLRLTGVPVIV